MKRAWAWLKQWLAGEPPEELYQEDHHEQLAKQILRKMEMGNWQFSWPRATRQKIEVVHPSLPALTELMATSRVMIIARSGIPTEAKRSASLGLTTVTVAELLADDQGRFKNPRETIKAHAEEVLRLCGSIRDLRKESPLRAEAYLGQCSHLFKFSRLILRIVL